MYDLKLMVPFTSRQKEIIELLCRGENAPNIALVLGLSVHTIRRHIANLYSNLGVKTRVQLIAVYSDLYNRKVDTQNVGTKILGPFSKREEEVWLLYRKGFSSKEIAGCLHISASTARTYLRRARNKLVI